MARAGQGLQDLSKAWPKLSRACLTLLALQGGTQYGCCSSSMQAFAWSFQAGVKPVRPQHACPNCRSTHCSQGHQDSPPLVHSS